MITQERIIISSILMIIALICYLISKRPSLSKKEEKELKELDDIIAKTYDLRSRELCKDSSFFVVLLSE